jgi:hypothetical protein
MKKLLELLVCFLHPLAVVLAWINLAGRSDLSGFRKLVWAVFMIVPNRAVHLRPDRRATSGELAGLRWNGTLR